MHPSKIAVPGGSVRAAARIWGMSKTTAAKWIREARTIPLVSARTFTPNLQRSPTPASRADNHLIYGRETRLLAGQLLPD